MYVTTQGSYLCHEGEAVLVRVEKETKLRVPIHTLGGIVCFGQVSCSPPLMWLCGERGVAISFLSEQGRFLARVEGPVSGNVLLRREQYRRVDVPAARVEIARGMVLAKVANCRTVLQRATRDHDDKPGTEQIERAVRRLGVLQEGIQTEHDLAVLRGREGDAANTYFEVMDHLITAQKEDFFFRGRSRRPPLDNMNALLSFTYTLLAHDASSALQAVGLDPQVGFLHAERPGRPSLALDLMEEFRPFLADRLVLSLVNLRQVQGKGFKKTESGAVEFRHRLETVINLDEDSCGYYSRQSQVLRHRLRRLSLARNSFSAGFLRRGLLTPN